MGSEKKRPDRPEQEAPTAPRPGYIPKPPSPADLERISEDQALITDEWTGEPPSRKKLEDPGQG